MIELWKVLKVQNKQYQYLVDTLHSKIVILLEFSGLHSPIILPFFQHLQCGPVQGRFGSLASDSSHVVWTTNCANWLILCCIAATCSSYFPCSLS